MLWRRVFSDISAWLTGLVSLLVASVLLGISGGHLLSGNLSKALFGGGIATVLAVFAFSLLLRKGLYWFERLFQFWLMRIALAPCLWLWGLIVLLCFRSYIFRSLFGEMPSNAQIMVPVCVGVFFFISHVFPGLAYENDPDTHQETASRVPEVR
ncbi:hypothetical protein [uncultured Celeribacter sp.]|uniref:hypothetical protein n=1 Tax=uncultured Celeribacter sp. TaxID=1303376 RepID=UPI002AA65A8A|nr:hypothetical protein [uncultured Celeribacter sp.]